MKYKKLFLALAVFGVFGGVGLVAPNTYAIGEEGQLTEIGCEATDITYKVEHDFTIEQPGGFRWHCENNTNFTFDLNGKKIESGMIWASNSFNDGTITLKDSVGGGYIKSMGDSELDPTVDVTTKTLSIESGHYYGRLILDSVDIRILNGVFEDGSLTGWNGRGDYQAILQGHQIIGGTFKNYKIDSMIINGGIFENTRITRSSINGGAFSGDTIMDVVVADDIININNGTFGDINTKEGVKLNICGGTFNGTISGEGDITISGGTFSERPDEKYLANGYAIYESDGKFVVDRSFTLTNFFQYMYVGQTNDAYISPAIISKTAKVTSSDESVVGISCKDSKKLLGQMLVESEDIISKACTITAKKAGKAVLSYTTDYGYKGDITVHVADIDATSYGDDAYNAKYELTARYLSVYIADPVEHAWHTTAPSSVGPGYDTYLEDLRKQFTGLVSAIDARHKIKLELNVENSTLDEEEKVLLDGKNIAAVYTILGSITDTTDKKTVVEEWRSGISSFPLPEILKNRNRTIQIATFVKIQQSADAEIENHVNFIEAVIKDGRIHIVPEGRISLYNNKFAIVYDGSVINPDGTTADTPAAPNSGFEEDLFKEGKSIFMILGLSTAVLLITSVIVAYGIHRKKAINKVRF